MARPIDPVKATVYEFGKRGGFARKTNTLWLDQDETIGVINLQRSNYSAFYYVNVALWLRALGSTSRPQEVNCHIRSRIESLVELPASNPSTFDPELDIALEDRSKAIYSCLSEVARILRACNEVSGLVRAPGDRLLSSAIWASAEARDMVALSAQSAHPGR